MALENMDAEIGQALGIAHRNWELSVFHTKRRCECSARDQP